MLQPAIVTVSQNLAAAVSVQEEQEHEHEQNSVQEQEHEQNSLPEQELGSWHEHLYEHEHEQDHDFDHDHESAATPADLNSSQVSEPVSSQPDPYSGMTPTGVSGSSTESVQPGFEEPSVGAAEADSGRGETPSDEPVDEPKTLSSGTDQSDKPFSFAQEPSVPVSTEDTSRSESSPVAAEEPLKFLPLAGTVWMPRLISFWLLRTDRILGFTACQIPVVIRLQKLSRVPVQTLLRMAIRNWQRRYLILQLPVILLPLLILLPL